MNENRCAHTPNRTSPLVAPTGTGEEADSGGGPSSSLLAMRSRFEFESVHSADVTDSTTARWFSRCRNVTDEMLLVRRCWHSMCFAQHLAAKTYTAQPFHVLVSPWTHEGRVLRGLFSASVWISQWAFDRTGERIHFISRSYNWQVYEYWLNALDVLPGLNSVS